MDINTLCEKIDLPELSTSMVKKILMDNDYSNIDLSLLKEVGRDNTDIKNQIGNDERNFKILALQLLCALTTYEDYKIKGIDDQIYFDTMKCFSRFIRECIVIEKQEGFDRDWWVARQLGMKVFRLGELEYEMTKESIKVHIPNDANLSNVDSSFIMAKEFFKKYYPNETKGLPYTCGSWLLAKELKDLLPCNSKILYFQSKFDIISYDEGSEDYLQWCYKIRKGSMEIKDLPEETTLQRKLKAHLLSGKTCFNGKGILKV